MTEHCFFNFTTNPTLNRRWNCLSSMFHLQFQVVYQSREAHQNFQVFCPGNK